jgi:hypothetical protein
VAEIGIDPDRAREAITCYFPVRAFIGTGHLLLDGMFEISGIAVKP